MSTKIKVQDYSVRSAIDTTIVLFQKPKDKLTDTDVWAYKAIHSQFGMGLAYMKRKVINAIDNGDKTDEEITRANTIISVLEQLLEITRYLSINWLSDLSEVEIERDKVYYTKQLRELKAEMVTLEVDQPKQD